MRVLLAIMQYDYGNKERGLSYEYANIYLPLCDLLGDDNVILFDFLTLHNEKGKNYMNAFLLDIVKLEKPDISLFCLFKSEFYPNSISSVRNFSRTCVYFFDDPWRQNFVREWIPYFDYFTTADPYMHMQYKSEGIKNVVYTPFGFNNLIYQKRDLPKLYDISFVGGYSPLRKWVIHLLQKSGLKVSVFGRGWRNEGEWVNQEKMVDIFNQTRINLNLSNGLNYDVRFLIWALKDPRSLKNVVQTKKNKEQVKARHFEICGCGGFQLSYFIPGLNLFYQIDKDIAVFENEYSLPNIIIFFLKNDSIRDKIANNGYLHSVSHHSSQGYLKNLINTISETNYNGHLCT